RGARGRGRQDARQPRADSAAQGRGSRDPQASRAEPALYRAAAPLQRGEPGERAGAVGYRPAIDLRGDHLDLTHALVRDREGPSLPADAPGREDRKSTRLNSSHVSISYAV